MDDFRIYSPEEVIASNLFETARRFDTVCEQELAHLRELALQIAEEGELSELLASLPDHTPPRFSADERVPAKNKAMLESLQAIRGTWRSVILCTELRRVLEVRHLLPTGFFFPDAEEIPTNAFHRIVYQKSSYTDSAYLKLSPLLSDPRVAYAHGFPSVCEEVYNGHCEFCILPVENSSEGQLNSFFRLIERYELKIAATCDVLGNDGGRVTRFALLRKNLLPLLAPESASYPRRFECVLPPEDLATVSNLMVAAQLCGLRLSYVNSLPQLGDSSRYNTHFSFFTKGGDLQAFLLYLAMEVPHYTPIGLYPHLA
ncbi:MAG: hypothetical protein IJW92_08385 [Clostridia bacterium]|nr:hypothetical protein [Clostridia bacterium]